MGLGQWWAVDARLNAPRWILPEVVRWKAVSVTGTTARGCTPIEVITRRFTCHAHAAALRRRRAPGCNSMRSGGRCLFVAAAHGCGQLAQLRSRLEPLVQGRHVGVGDHAGVGDEEEEEDLRGWHRG